MFLKLNNGQTAAADVLDQTDGCSSNSKCSGVFHMLHHMHYLFWDLRNNHDNWQVLHGVVWVSSCLFCVIYEWLNFLNEFIICITKFFCLLFFAVQEGQVRQHELYAAVTVRLGEHKLWQTDIISSFTNLAVRWGELHYLRLLKLLKRGVCLPVVSPVLWNISKSLQQQTLKVITF